MQQSNTILSSASSLFTFLVSMAVLREKFTWLKLCSVLLCMLGTIVVSLADSEQDKGSVSHAVWGDMLCLLSALFYAIYTTLLRKCLPDEDSTQGKASTALFFGYLGLFNALLLAPVGFLYFAFVEPFHRPTLTQFGLVMCKGLLTPTELLSSVWAVSHDYWSFCPCLILLSKHSNNLYHSEDTRQWGAHLWD
jgi:solute carrier family 35 protein F5